MKKGIYVKPLHRSLVLLQHGDLLLLREIAEHIDQSTYQVSNLVQNYRECFVRHQIKQGTGTGSGCTKKYSISEEGKARLAGIRNEEYVPAEILGRNLIMTRQPVLMALHLSVFFPIHRGNSYGNRPIVPA